MGNTVPVSLGEKVFSKLEMGILSGEIPRGKQLVECNICEKYGVSRTPVRDALKTLEKKHLIEITPNKGAIVLGITKKDILDIYDVRLCIEGLACYLAAEHFSDEASLSSLKEALELSEFYAKKKNSSQMQELDFSFHSIIYKMSENRALGDTLSSFHHITCAYRQKALSDENRAKKALEEHRRIFEAIKSGDKEAAAKFAKIHIQNAKDNLSKTQID